MSLDISGWLTAPEAMKKYGISSPEWYRYVQPHLRGQGGTRKTKSKKNGRMYFWTVYDPMIIEVAYQKGMNVRDRERIRREDRVWIGKLSLAEWAERIDDVGFTPGSAGE